MTAFIGAIAMLGVIMLIVSATLWLAQLGNVAE